MSCNLIYNKQGKLTGVLNDDGTPSLLYKEAANKFGQEEGLNIFLTSKSDEFTEMFGQDEPELSQVLNFITAQNQTTEQLSTEQKIAAREFLISSPAENYQDLQQRLKDVFYDENGIFIADADKLSKSGLYSPYEAQHLQKDVELQPTVKNVIEALENTPIEETDLTFSTPLEKTGEFNDFGKLQILNPYIVEANILQTLGGIKNQEEFNDKLLQLEYPNFHQKVDKEQLFQEMSQLQRAEVYQEVDGEISNQTVSNTAIILPQVVQPSENFEMIKDLQFLLAMRQDVLDENPAQTKVMLKSVEDGAVAEGIDLIGLSEKAVDLAFLNSLNTFILFPSKENTEKFAAEYDRFFEKDIAPQTTPVEAQSGRNYVHLNTKLSEQEIFQQSNLIKAKDGLYIKVKPKPLEDMYDILLTYPEKFAAEIKTKEQLKKFVQNEVSQMEGFTDADTAEAVYLFKRYFETTVNKPNYEIEWLDSEEWEYNEDTDEYEVGSTKNFNIETRGNSLVFLFKDKKRQKAVIKELDTPVIVDLERDNFNRIHISGVGNYNRGLGFGKEIYSALIEGERIISTSDGVSSSEDAQRVWNSLIKNNNYYCSKIGPHIAVSKYESEIDRYIEKVSHYGWGKGIKGIPGQNNMGKTENAIHDIPTVEFTGSQEYLTTDFVSDFWIDSLKEKAKNSELWKNFYSNFGVNAKGLYLINNDPLTIATIQDYLNSGEIKRTEDLRQYSILSQQMPNFAEETEVEITQQTLRNEAINNTQSVRKFTGQLYRVNEEVLVLKSSNEKFIRLNDGNVYENLESDDNLSLYTRLPKNDSNYNLLNEPAPQTNIRLKDYLYLENSPEKFTKQENKLSSVQKSEIIKDRFEC